MGDMGDDIAKGCFKTALIIGAIGILLWAIVGLVC